MVCSKCEKKLAKLANPDVWRDGGRNSTMYGKAGGRAVGENMLLKHKQRDKANPYSHKCKVCRQSIHQQGVYCSACAYKGGFCAMCGKEMVDVSGHCQSLA
uniref:Cysteine-rich PDZ-binding protein n=1 Tax=Alexandrium catenella TaxID=2925 RepID=A0A7S1WGE9_ALECA|mmetsp:Transcript_58436/g.156446  ORF Transcript_58436/g.156446 Transcript_58436/m.156446 type:complete len:101 (+) Transcript_58436:91-393(+)